MAMAMVYTVVIYQRYIYSASDARMDAYKKSGLENDTKCSHWLESIRSNTVVFPYVIMGSILSALIVFLIIFIAFFAANYKMANCISFRAPCGDLCITTI